MCYNYKHNPNKEVLILALLPYIGVILSALVELAKLLVELAKDKDSNAIEECSLEIEKARLSGDTAKLNQLIEQMKKGKACK